VTITAIVITYNPNLNVLRKVIESLSCQVGNVTIVDNGSTIKFGEWSDGIGINLSMIALEKNRGIGFAQNVGIKDAQNRGDEFVLLMDQDSIPDSHMCDELLKTYYDLTFLQHEKVSAVGPTTKDSVNGSFHHHSRLTLFGLQRNPCKKDKHAVISDNLIASGSLINLSLLQEIGLMDEGLFIDRVDTEWLLRARSMGYQSWGCCRAFMSHSLGEHRMRIWLFRWRNIAFHKPFRYYYIYRNSSLLIKRKYIPTCWKIDELLRLLKIAVFMLIFHRDRFYVFKMMARGIADGLRNHIGLMPYE
jgi:rhamnosyltransferase